MGTRALELSTADGVAEVRLTGPGKGNALGPDFWRECPELFAQLDQDPAVRVVLLAGAGDHFSYGLDLLAMAAELGSLIAGTPSAADRTRLYQIIRRMQAAPDCVARCRKPVIAAVQGWCIGGGLDLISACDLRLCAADARFSLREVKLAMVADLGALQRLPAIVGEAAARELAYTGKDIDAERALRIGLVSEVFADAEALRAGARRLAGEIAANPPLVVQGIKQVMSQRLQPEIDRSLEQVAAWNAAFLPSQDLLEALAAFTEKRAPVFRGG